MAGRPRGIPKTGGRKKGSTNKINADLRLEAQKYTAEALSALVLALKDPFQYVAAAKIILAYGHGAPRAAIDINVKPVYVIADRPLDSDEWTAKYAEPSCEPGPTKPTKPARRVATAKRPTKRAR